MRYRGWLLALVLGCAGCGGALTRGDLASAAYAGTVTAKSRTAPPDADAESTLFHITLVRDALRERTLLRNNAPHLVHDMPFLIPCRSLWQRLFYGIGLKVYDFLAVRNSLRIGPSRDQLRFPTSSSNSGSSFCKSSNEPVFQ